MNKIIPLIAIAMVFTQVLQAQIKRTYKDEKFAKQTVVVKENATQSDLDILNSQFDLDDVAVGEVIRITTETMPEQAPQTIEEPIEEIVALVVPEQEIEEEEEEKIEEVVIQEKETPAKKTSVRSMGSSSKKVKSKRRNPKVKKKKRKRSKRNRWKNKCYRF